MYAIEIENLTKKYGEFIAVDNLTLNIEKGIIFGFLGPNGAGKTTYDVLKSPIKAKNLLGYLPENATLYEELTAWRNLEFFASFYRIPNREKEKRIEELLKLPKP